VLHVVPLAPRHHPSLRSLLDEVDQSRWAYDFTEREEPEFPVYVAVTPSGDVAGVIEGRFDSNYDDRFRECAGDLPHAWVFLIATRPNYRRAGIGRELLRTFVRDAASAGCTFLALTPDQEEPRAGRIAFFSSCGLRPLLPQEPADVMGASLGHLMAVLDV
jgi:GNAT superfamily N-acetyltransferase